MIVLGLDGATFSLIRPWAEAGELPTFRRLLDESLHGELESTVPEITVPAWPSFATGRSPEQLDMYGFTHFNRETNELDLSHDEFVRGKMWDAVDDQGGRSVVFNIPGSYPWQAFDGVLIAAAPEYKDEYAYPPEAWDELVGLVDGYKLRNDEVPGSRAYVDQSLSLVDKRFTAFEHFIRSEDPDLAVGLIRATDRVAHHYWDTAVTEENALLEVYRRVDERLGAFLDAHEDDDVIVMSDHGFERVTAVFAPNKVLTEEGFVRLTESGDSAKAALGKARDAASGLFGRLGLLSYVRRLVPEEFVNDLPTGDHLSLANAINLGRLDFERTRAIADVGQKTTLVYALSDDPSTVEEVCDEAERALEGAAADVGIDVRFERLARGGPHTPDLAMIIETPEVHASSRFDADEVLMDADTSGHAREGIFFATGPSFRTGTVEGAEITDVAPTVLHGSGYRIPEAATGRVLDVFDSDSPPASRSPIRYEFEGADAVTEGGLSGDEEGEDEVRSRLKELGYLE
jgi:predicted AlkP superfamily phosphohydrolase/phosphomutase